MRPPSTAPTEPTPALVRAELARILTSEIFARSDRLSAFLTFVVEQTLNGQGDSLKEHVIAIELYGKGADFNAAADPIVRVDARRLRDKLREYYASAPHDGIVISVPKGSYTPVFDVVVPPVNVAVETTAARRQGRAAWRWVVAGVALVLVGALVWLVLSLGRDTDSAHPLRLLTVTSLPGTEEDPALSPDGNLVAFSWSGPKSAGGDDVWVKSVDGEALRQLTNTPNALEKYPKWSPDGQQVAFTRLARIGGGVFVVSALGGPERLIAERSAQSSWTPDGRAMVMVERTPPTYALVVHVIETGARRQLTQAPLGLIESHPRVSPDGKSVAFTRYGVGRSALYVVAIEGGEPELVGEWMSGPTGGLEWTPDGRELLFARPELSGRRLVRMPLRGGGPGTPVSEVPFGWLSPSVSRPRAGNRYRLALAGGQTDVGLRMVDLQAARQGETFASVTPFCDATRMDAPGRFSPDGSRVAFTSDRGGSQQVWVAGRDGSELRSVTRLQNASVNVGSWSPDGQWVIFDATVAGNTDIYAIRVDGGSLKRMTDSPALEIDPEWSHDGRWVYFSSNESGSPALWKMPAAGGSRVRITSEPAFEPREAPDGQSIYFVDARRYYALGPTGRLKQVATDGGPVTVVHPAINPGAWEITDAGIVFLVTSGSRQEKPDEPDVLAIADFQGQHVRPLGTLPFRVSPFASNRFLVASRDGRSAVLSHVDNWDRDIMVVDNFR